MKNGVNDFSDLAAAAKAKNDERLANKRQQIERAEKLADDKFKGEIAKLNRFALPVLHDAASAIRDSGVHVSVDDNWSNVSNRPAIPCLRLFCRRPPMRAGGPAGADIFGLVLSVTVEDERIVARLTGSTSSPFHGPTIDGDWPKSAQKGVSDFLAGYYKAVERVFG